MNRRILIASHATVPAGPGVADLATIYPAVFSSNDGYDVYYDGSGYSGIIFRNSSTLPATQADIEACMPFQVFTFSEGGLNAYNGIMRVDPVQNSPQLISNILQLATRTLGGRTYFSLEYGPSAPGSVFTYICCLTNAASSVSKIWRHFYD